MSPRSEVRRSPSSRRSTLGGGVVSTRHLEVMSEIADAILSGDDYDQVVGTLVEKVATTVGARAAGIMLYDEGSGELVTQRPAFGLSDDVVEAYRVLVSAGGPEAAVFVTGEPYFTNDSRQDPRPLDPFVAENGIKRVLTISLKANGRAIGVFHAVDKRDGDFTDDDSALLMRLAPQLAAFVHCAVMLRALTDRERQLERVVEVHEELVNILLAGEGTSAIVLRVSALVRMPALLADVTGALITADVAAITAAGIELDRLERELGAGIAKLSRSRRRSRFSTGLGIDVILAPVQFGSDSFGYLAALDVGGSAGDADSRVLEQAAVLVALETIRARELQEARRRLDADLLDRLFNSTSDEEALGLVNQLRVKGSPGYRGAILALTVGQGETMRFEAFQARKSRVLRWLTGVLADPAYRGAVVDRGEQLWIVLPSPGEAHERESRGLRDLARRAAASDLADYHCVLGIGRFSDTPSRLRASFDEAMKAVAVAERFQRYDRAVFYDELGIYRIVGQPAESDDLRAFVASVLGPVIEHDERGSSGWIDFLAVLIDANLNLAATAARTGLHINTVKYRSRRLQELMNRDFGKAVDRFEIQLALELRAADIGEKVRVG
jgi:GAF domain-containing protein